MPYSSSHSIFFRLATSLTFLLLLTVATRLTFAIIESRKIPKDQLARAVFETETGSIARSLALGKGFASPYERESGPTAILPPVYPLIVAATFKLFGIQSSVSFYFLVALNIAFAALTCIPIYKIGLRLGGPSTAAIATWLWALFPNGIFIPFEWIWETSLSALLAATLLWFTLEISESTKLRDFLLYGALWGFTLMTNPVLGAALPIFLIWTIIRSKSKFPQSFSRPALVFAIALLCCVPWTIRNYSTFHRFIPFRSGFGFELYIGNNENYAPPFLYPPRVSFEREQLRYLHLGEVSFMEEEKRKAIAFIKENPTTFARLVLNRTVQFWVGLIHPLDAFNSHPALSDRFILLNNLLAPFIALTGAFLLIFKRHPLTIPLLTFPVAYPIVYYITHASLRYRHPLDPILFLFVAFAITYAASPHGDHPQTAFSRD
jgi:4-amino-4-deoxy-L-arabinose transferase-like glycosyltransferase